MLCSIKTHLPVSIDSAWAAVKKPKFLVYVSRGLLRFSNQGKLPPEWMPGQTFQTRLWFFNILPSWWLHHLTIDAINEERHQINSQERGSFYTWNHSIKIFPESSGCRYQDEIEIHAGPLTGLVWCFAQIFYRYRQMRWRRLTSRPKRLPHRATWNKLLQKKDTIRRNPIIHLVQKRYQELMAQRQLYIHSALSDHLERQILPALALYQILQEEFGDREAALLVTGELIIANALPQFKLQSLMLRLFPDPFKLFRLIFPKVMKSFPPEGWEMRQTEFSNQRIAFNTYGCFYVNILTTYGVPELTALFCQTDDIGAQYLPPSIRFIRTKTLGRGNEVCDFQYCRNLLQKESR